MQKIMINTSYGQAVWGMHQLKFLIGGHEAWRSAIFSTMRACLEHTLDSEYSSAMGIEERVTINDERVDAHTAELIILEPLIDFRGESKGDFHCLLVKYVEALSELLPYQEAFVTYDHVRQSMLNDHAEDALNIEVHDDIQLVFEPAPLTPKLIQKMFMPRLVKAECEAIGIDLTLEESIMLQVEVIKRYARVTKKIVFVVYDGPVNNEIEHCLRTLASLDQVRCIVSVRGEHEPHVLEDYVILGKHCIDLADDEAVYELLEMEMSYVGDKMSLWQDISAYMRGERNQKNLYLRKIFGHLL